MKIGDIVHFEPTEPTWVGTIVGEFSIEYDYYIKYNFPEQHKSIRLIYDIARPLWRKEKIFLIRPHDKYPSISFQLFEVLYKDKFDGQNIDDVTKRQIYNLLFPPNLNYNDIFFVAPYFYCTNLDDAGYINKQYNLYDSVTFLNTNISGNIIAIFADKKSVNNNVDYMDNYCTEFDPYFSDKPLYAVQFESDLFEHLFCVYRKDFENEMKGMDEKTKLFVYENFVPRSKQHDNIFTYVLPEFMIKK